MRSKRRKSVVLPPENRGQEAFLDRYDGMTDAELLAALQQVESLDPDFDWEEHSKEYDAIELLLLVRSLESGQPLPRDDARNLAHRIRRVLAGVPWRMMFRLPWESLPYALGRQDALDLKRFWCVNAYRRTHRVGVNVAFAFVGGRLSLSAGAVRASYYRARGRLFSSPNAEMTGKK